MGRKQECNGHFITCVCQTLARHSSSFELLFNRKHCFCRYSFYYYVLCFLCYSKEGDPFYCKSAPPLPPDVKDPFNLGSNSMFAWKIVSCDQCVKEQNIDDTSTTLTDKYVIAGPRITPYSFWELFLYWDNYEMWNLNRVALIRKRFVSGIITLLFCSGYQAILGRKHEMGTFSASP